MSFTQLYFGKGFQTITYQDVTDFFTAAKEESDKIEFKCYHSPGENDRDKENGLIRAICAFLNSGGGLIVWGAPIGQNVAGQNEKIFRGVLSPVTRLVEKDYFINRVTDSITPAPNSINFVRVEDNGNYVYLIDVAQSEYSPHQFRNTYYMRIDGQTKPAPHHYIEALFKKITYPKLKGFVKIERFDNDGRFFYIELAVMIFNLSKLQNEHKPFYRIVVGHGVVFNSSLTSSVQNRYFMQGHELRVNDNQTIYYNQPFRFTEILRINPQELQARNFEFDISFFFGGENSPLLLSKYTLQINFSNLIVPRNLNDFITSSDENRYYFEHSDSLGVTEDERIRQILDRT